MIRAISPGQRASVIEVSDRNRRSIERLIRLQKQAAFYVWRARILFKSTSDRRAFNGPDVHTGISKFDLNTQLLGIVHRLGLPGPSRGWKSEAGLSSYAY